MEGYLTARVFAEGLRKAGRNPTRDSLIAGLESIRDLDMGGFTISFSPKNHQGSTYTDLTIVGRSGRFMR
jgi:ABC-type branched-subunit amino acid transport system substrate-binding protein